MVLLVAVGTAVIESEPVLAGEAAYHRAPAPAPWHFFECRRPQRYRLAVQPPDSQGSSMSDLRAATYDEGPEVAGL
jgi:hypothetical protein